MALTSCLECSSALNPEDLACGKCGAPNQDAVKVSAKPKPVRSRLFLKIVVGLVVVAGAFAIISRVRTPSSDPKNFDQKADWQMIAASDDASTLVSMDFASISNSEPYTKVWVRGDYMIPQIEKGSGGRFNSVIMRYYVDCQKQVIGQTSYSAYSKFRGNGEVVAARSFKPSQVMFDEAEPESISQTIIQYACGSNSLRQKKKEENGDKLDKLLTELESK